MKWIKNKRIVLTGIGIFLFLLLILSGIWFFNRREELQEVKVEKKQQVIQKKQDMTVEGKSNEVTVTVE